MKIVVVYEEILRPEEEKGESTKVLILLLLALVLHPCLQPSLVTFEKRIREGKKKRK